MTEQTQISIELVKLAKILQPSITKTANGISITTGSNTFSVKQTRSSVISENRARFR